MTTTVPTRPTGPTGPIDPAGRDPAGREPVGGGARPAVTKDRRFPLLRNFMHRPVGVVAAVFLLIVVLAVIFAPLLAPDDPLDQDFEAVLSGPTGHHLLGTDRLGRDVLSRLLYGGRVTLFGVLEAVLVAFVLGVVFGLAAGYLGRFTDNLISRITEVVMAIPGIVVLLMAYSLSDNNADAGMITLGVLSAPTLIRVTRGAAQAVRSQTFVSASRVVGLGRWGIVLRHVLPNIWGPIIVNTSVLAAVVLGIQGGLNYINLGVDPPNPSWGGMVAEGQQVLSQQSWLIVPSGLIIALTIIALILVADALRDATSAGLTRSTPTRRTGVVAPSTAAAAPTAGDPEFDGLPVAAATLTELVDARPGDLEKPTDPALASRSATTATEAMTDRDAVLSVRGLSVAFGGLEVVRNVSFRLRPGETLGIVGESGCGKTVTASAVLGSLGGQATVGGAVVFDGVELLTADRKHRASVRGSGIAYISQDPMVALDPCFSVGSQLGELIGRHDRLRGTARNQRVLELLGQVGLPDPADVVRRFPHQLSGGMAQRVSIACALAGRPRVLVADEPTTALDVTIQGEILDLLRRINDETGMAIVLITHDLGVVADLCTRVIVMYAGEIVEAAQVRELFANPAHPYTRALLASNPVAAQRGEMLTSIPGTVPAPADWPRGCHFFDRCPVHLPSCAAGPIPLEHAAPGHLSRCIRTHEPLAQDLAAVGGPE